MKRKIYDRVLAWKQLDQGRSAVLIQGARRVGKSYIVEEFAKSEYKSYILIDFNRASQQLKDLFIHDLDDMDTFFLKLKAVFNVELFPRESVIVSMWSLLENIVPTILENGYLSKSHNGQNPTAFYIKV